VSWSELRGSERLTLARATTSAWLAGCRIVDSGDLGLFESSWSALGAEHQSARHAVSQRRWEDFKRRRLGKGRKRPPRNRTLKPWLSERAETVRGRRLARHLRLDCKGCAALARWMDRPKTRRAFRRSRMHPCWGCVRGKT
jgi:hypothetical protein